MKDQISPSGVRFIQRWEGCVLSAYQDTGGVWTIGYGHTSGVFPGMNISAEDAIILLMEDIFPVETCINELVHVELNTSQVDALCSFIFNVGRNAFRTSTLLKHLNAERYDAAADEFLRWCYDNGRVIAGLLNRREAERELFIS